MTTKLCPWRDHVGERELPLSEFPANKQKRDGLHPYCRSCCRANVNSQRAARKQMKQNQELARQHGNTHYSTIRESNYKAELRVLHAIKKGARTQRDIRREAKLLPEQLGLALVQLMLVDKKVVSRINGNEREYFVRAA
jgi:hypothetical protein